MKIWITDLLYVCTIICGSISGVLTCEFNASYCSPLPPPPDPVLYEDAVAEQKKRAYSIVYGMSAGLYTKLFRLVICPPGW